MAIEKKRSAADVVLDTMAEEIMLVSKNREVLYANKALLDAADRGESEVIGKPCYEITHRSGTPCEPPNDPCPAAEALKGEACTCVHTHRDEAGNELYIEITAYPLKEREEIVGFVHVARDITESKMAEEARMRVIETVAEERAREEERAAADRARIEELEKFARLTVDREMRIVELKKKVKELEERLAEK